MQEHLLEDFPSERRGEGYERSHVLLPIQRAYDSVDFEFDVVFSAPEGNLKQLLNIFAGFASSDLDICITIEGVARDSKDMDKRGVLAQELLGNFRAIRDDAHALQLQVLFSVAEKLTQKGLIEERLTTGEIELLHPCFFQEPQPLLRGIQVQDVGACLGVEAEAACVVAFSGEVIIHRDWGFDGPMLSMLVAKICGAAKDK
jgi:hypothetical protein